MCEESKANMSSDEGKNVCLKKIDWLYIAFGIIFVLISMLRFIQYDKSIMVWGDEFGYWSGAAYFLGIDWSEVVSTNKFYGVGYGLILAPVMKFFGYNAILMKQVSVVIQGILLSSCIFVCFYICRYYYKLKDSLICLAISLISICYVSNIVYVNLTVVEVILCVIVWWTGFFLVRYTISDKIINIFLMNILCLYSYTVHSRGIGLIVVAILIDFFLIFQRQSIKTVRKKFGIYLLVLILVFAAFHLTRLARNDFITTLYSAAEHSSIEGNLETGKISKLAYVFTKNGFLSLWQNFFGNVYYLLAGTIGIFAFSVFSFCKESILTINSKKITDLYQFFVFLCFMVAFGICIVYWFGGDTRLNDRVDSLFYGRYYEYTLGPCIMIGMVYLTKQLWSKLKIQFICVITTLLLLTIFCFHNISANGNLSVIWYSCVAVARYFYQYRGNNEAVTLLIGKLSVCIIMLLLFLIKKLGSRLKIILIALICIGVWEYNAGVLFEKYVYTEWASALMDSQIDISQKLDRHIDDVYIYEAKLGGVFQFLDVYKQVHMVESLDELKNLDQDTYLITNKSFEDINSVKKFYEGIYENEDYIIWKKYAGK